MDQFTYAERATDWRGNNNIAESIWYQMAREPFPQPSWVVMSAGIGGTSATLGRYIRYQDHPTRLMVVDPEHSVFHAFFRQGDHDLPHNRPSRIEGIGRPRVELSFIVGVGKGTHRRHSSLADSAGKSTTSGRRRILRHPLLFIRWQRQYPISFALQSE